MKRKMLALMMVAALAIGILAGCGSQATTVATTTVKGTTGSTTAAATTAAPAKQYTISIFTTRVAPDSNSAVMQKIQAKLGQKLEVTAVADADYASKLNLYVAGNQMPDIYSPNNNVDAMKAAATLTEDEIKTHMTGTYKLFSDRLQTYGYNKVSVMKNWSVDGKLKGFSNGSLGNFTPYGVAIRTDLLTDIGVTMPKTIADWDNVLKTFKAKYPAKYPITGKAKDAFSQSFYMFFAAYGLTYNAWQLSDGKLVYGPFMPAWKDALTQLQTWYKAGYINPEWFTMDSQAYTNEFINGNTLCFQYWSTGNQIDPPYNEGTVLAQAVAKNPKATFTWAPFPTWKSGVKPIVTNYSMFGTNMVSFAGSLEKDKDKLHAAMKVWDTLFNDKDLYIMMRYGIEGTHYDLANGVPVTKQAFSTQDAKAKEGFGWPTAGGLDPAQTIADALKPAYAVKNYKDLIGTDNGIMGKNTVDYGFNRVTGSLVTAAGENLDTENSTYLTQWNTVFTAIVIGQKPVSAYDDLVAQWKKEVGDDMTKLANDTYLQQWK